MSLSEITSLQSTLNEALDVFKAELAAQDFSEPSLNTSNPHPTDAITFLPTPAMFEARRTALASLVNSTHFSSWRINNVWFQNLIKTLIQSPHDALVANTYMAFEAPGLRLVADIGLATILGDSDDGLSITDIAEKTGVDALKLGKYPSVVY